MKEATEEYPEELDESDADASLKKKAEKTGMPFGILKQVFKRGVLGELVIDLHKPDLMGTCQSEQALQLSQKEHGAVQIKI